MAGHETDSKDPSRGRAPLRMADSVSVPSVPRPPLVLRVAPRPGETGARVLGQALVE